MNPMGQKARAIALLFAKDEMEAAERKVKEISETLKQKETEINNLKSDMQGIKHKYSSYAAKATPAPKNKAHEHDATPTPEALLKMSEQVSEAINELKTAKS